MFGRVIKISIGSKIKEMLELRHMTIQELSDHAKLSKSLLSELINGKRTSITTDTLKKIAKALGIHPAYFLEEDTIGPGELLSHIKNEEDRRFILSDEGALWIKVSREAAERGLSPEKIRALIKLLKDSE